VAGWEAVVQLVGASGAEFLLWATFAVLVVIVLVGLTVAWAILRRTPRSVSLGLWRVLTMRVEWEDPEPEAALRRQKKTMLRRR
jgi:hypothetical protein